MEKIKALIVSLDEHVEPVVKSLRHYRPRFVSFLVSQDAIHAVASVRARAGDLGLSFESQTTLVDEPDNPYECIEKVREAMERVTARGYSGQEMIVDYSGGTKNMSVALALVATNRGVSFTYAGGARKTGAESEPGVGGRADVWDFGAVADLRNLMVLFNQNQFRAARSIIDGLVEKGVRNKAALKKMALVVEGYYRWDIFRHGEALNAFRKSRLEELLELPSGAVKRFVEETRGLLGFLESLANTKKVTRNHVLDLFANAERRFDEGKIDDAVLRLYRLVEMAAQERLLTVHGVDASNAKARAIPQALREELVKRHKDDRDGRIKLPLMSCYRALNAMGDDLGKHFVEHEARFRDLLASRNYSYLVHGIVSAKERTYESLRDFVLEVGMLKKEAVPAFPKLRYE
jgi:CRISPR-associated protein (TIGR02710 family)